MKKKQGDQIQLSPEKKTAEKRKWIHHITLVVRLCYKTADSSILQEFFSIFFKINTMQWRKNIKVEIR